MNASLLRGRLGRSNRRSGIMIGRSGKSGIMIGRSGNSRIMSGRMRGIMCGRSPGAKWLSSKIAHPLRKSGRFMI